jgi:uncharacterized protein (DUF924 family)
MFVVRTIGVACDEHRTQLLPAEEFVVDEHEIAEPSEVVTFWFGADEDDPLARQEQWWVSGDEFDAKIERRFAPTLRAADQGELRDWRDEPTSLLALVLVFDQFSRNIFRGSARAFAWDEQSLALTDRAMETGMDQQLSLVKRWFLYLPLMHTESIERQRQSVEVFDSLRQEADKGTEVRAALDGAVEFARHHRDIVEEFGRFPHRNEALGREPTDAEEAYLADDGARFGQ